MSSLKMTNILSILRKKTSLSCVSEPLTSSYFLQNRYCTSYVTCIYLEVLNYKLKCLYYVNSIYFVFKNNGKIINNRFFFYLFVYILSHADIFLTEIVTDKSTHTRLAVLG